MLLQPISGETIVEVKKKGRKPVKKPYFDVEEEMAVVRFLSSECPDERNDIYNEFLRKPLDKMISSIIRRYKLYRQNMDFEEIHNDTHSFLMTKVEKFKPSRNKKAYSYFGTICKNYLMGQIIKDQKDINRKVSYEDISSDLENNPNLSYTLEKDGLDSERLIEFFLKELDNFILTGNLNENEKKLGYALTEIFKDYNMVFLSSENNKFNKNLILLSLREMTNLSTKEIRSSIKKYKNLYHVVLEKVIQ